MAARITDTRQKRKSTRTYECDGPTEAPDPGAHFDPGERPGGASPKKLLRKESKLLKQQGDGTSKPLSSTDEASTGSPEKATRITKHAKERGRSGADTDLKIDEIEPREQKFSPTDHDASNANDNIQKNSNKNRFASLMETDMEDEDTDDEADPEEPKKSDDASEASDVPPTTTITPLESPSMGSTSQKNSEDENTTNGMRKRAMRQAKRERRRALLLRNKNIAPPIFIQTQQTLPSDNTQQDMFTMLGIRSKVEIRAEDTTSRTAREGHDSDISLQDFQNPPAKSPNTTPTPESQSPNNHNLKICPQKTQLDRTTVPSPQSVRRNPRARPTPTPPTPEKKNHDLEPADTTVAEILGNRTLSQKHTTAPELPHNDNDNSLAGAYHHHEGKGGKKRNEKKETKKSKKKEQTNTYDTGKNDNPLHTPHDNAANDDVTPNTSKNHETPKKMFFDIFDTQNNSRHKHENDTPLQNAGDQNSPPPTKSKPPTTPNDAKKKKRYNNSRQTQQHKPYPYH
jgi:hypothetical protein